MRTADIIPGRDYAVRLPAKIEPPHVGGDIVFATAGRHTAGRNAQRRVFDIPAYARPGYPANRLMPPRMIMLSPQNVLMPWAQYKFDKEWSEAIEIDERRDALVAREVENARRAVAIDALRGITIPGSADHGLPERDLGELLHEIFIDVGADARARRIPRHRRP